MLLLCFHLKYRNLIDYATAVSFIGILRRFITGEYARCVVHGGVGRASSDYGQLRSVDSAIAEHDGDVTRGIHGTLV